MAAKKITIGNGKQNATDVVTFDIRGKSYNVPLARTMKYKELKALKTDDDVFAMFAKHIPAEVMDDLTMGELTQMSEAWADANQELEKTSLGES